MRVLVCVVILLLTSVPFSAQAQRVYTKQGDGGIEDKGSKSYLELNTTGDPKKDTRVNDRECAALRKNTSNANSKGYIADITRIDMAKTPAMICPCAPKPGLWTERLVFCMASAPDGMVYNVIQDLISRMSGFYLALYAPLIIMATAWFGWKMASGQVKQLNKEAFIYAAKVGGVMTFLAFFPQIHAKILLMVQGLAEIPSAALAGFSDICNRGPDARKPDLWAQWDCAFGKLTGMTVPDPEGNVAGGGLFMGIGAFLMSSMTNPFGFMTGIAGFAFIGALFLAAIRAVQSYLMAIIGVSFLVLIAPLFVPLILFGVSMRHFSGWLQQLISYMIQPMILMLFMGISLTGLQYAVFQGPNSLYGTITNTNASTPQYFGHAMYSNAGSGVDISRNFRKERIIKGQILVNPEKMKSVPNSPNSMGYDRQKDLNSSMQNVPTSPQINPNDKDAIEIGPKLYTTDMKVTDDLNARPGAVSKFKDYSDYIKRVALSTMTTLVLSLSILVMLGKMPSMVEQLTGGSGLTGAKLPGADLVKKASAQAIQAAKAFIDIKTGGMASKASGAVGKR